MLYKSQPYTLVSLSLRAVLSTSRRRKSLLLFFAHEMGLQHVSKIIVSLRAKFFLVRPPNFKKEFSKCSRTSGQKGMSVHSTYPNEVTDCLNPW